MIFGQGKNNIFFPLSMKDVLNWIDLRQLNINLLQSAYTLLHTIWRCHSSGTLYTVTHEREGWKGAQTSRQIYTHGADTNRSWTLSMNTEPYAFLNDNIMFIKRIIPTHWIFNCEALHAHSLYKLCSRWK